MSLDPASLIVSVAALVTAAGGIWSSRAGRADSAEQQEVARKVNERDASWRERGEIITDLRAELDRKQQDADRERLRAAAAEDQAADQMDLIAAHESWDLARLHERPGTPAPPPLRVPRPRPPTD